MFVCFSFRTRIKYWRRVPCYAMVKKLMQIRIKIVRHPCWSPTKLIKTKLYWRHWDNPKVMSWCSVWVTGYYCWHQLFELAAWISSASWDSTSSWKTSIRCYPTRSRRTEEVPAELRCILSGATASAGGVGEHSNFKKILRTRKIHLGDA